MTDFPRYSPGRGRFNVTLIVVVAASLIGIPLAFYGFLWLFFWLLKIFGA